MDADRFDTMTRAIAAPSSRRVLVGIGLAVGLGSQFGFRDAGAKRKKHHKKKRCRAKCDGKTCGSNGCGGSCGDCSAPLTCLSGNCACPDGGELCGGECLPPCPASTPGRVVARHPATCECCVRPGYYPCPDSSNNQCCAGPDDLPCCAQPCEPLAVDPYCPEGVWTPPYGFVCHYDVECYVGNHCPEGNDPRLCVPIP